MTIPMTRNAVVFAALMLSAIGAQAAMLTAQNGMTIYTFDKDTAGVSTCYDDCAVKWPANVGKEGDALTEGWTLAKRTDGTMQLAFNGKPTYLFQGDVKKGDMAGDGVGGVWHIINEQNNTTIAPDPVEPAPATPPAAEKTAPPAAVPATPPASTY